MDLLTGHFYIGKNYLGEVIMFFSGLPENLSHVHVVVVIVVDHGLKLKTEMCSFFKESVKLLEKISD